MPFCCSLRGFWRDARERWTGPRRCRLSALIACRSHCFIERRIRYIDSADPTYGSGSRNGSVGLVAEIGVGLILLGIVIMMIMNVISPAYFKGETMPVAGAPIMEGDPVARGMSDGS